MTKETTSISHTSLSSDARSIGRTTSTRIRRIGWRRAALFAWIVLLLITVGLFSVNLATFAASSSVPCRAPQTCSPFALTEQLVVQMAEYGLPASFWAAHIVALDVIMVTGYIAAAALLVVRRADDWLVLIASSTLLTVSINLALSNSVSPFSEGDLAWLSQGHILLSIYLGLKFLLHFPNGHAVPSWGYVWVYGGLAWEIVRRLLNFSLIVDGRFQLPVFLATFVFVTCGLVAQIYRYRFISTPAQRQQTKWVVLGAVLSIAGLTLSVTLYFGLLPALTGNTFWLNIVLRLLYYAALFAIPIGLVFSVLRFRIWEADLALNRSFVYTLLTLLLIAIFALTLLGTRALLLLILGRDSSEIATLIAAVGAAASFNPARIWVRRQVDRRLFGLRQDLNVLRQREASRHEIETDDMPTLVAYGTRAFGVYRLGEVIGKGGMGHVVRAMDTLSGGQVAIKVLADKLHGDREAVQRFEREAAIARSLRHPGINPVIDFGAHEDQPYLVMPFVEGKDLDAVLKARGVLPPEEVFAILKDIAAALDYVHQQGIVHRDIKPGNIMIRPDGRAVLLDFGVARLMHDSSPLTGASGIVGTVGYAAPEQLAGDVPVDARTDVYALGVLAFQMLTGRLPFTGNVGVMVFAHLNKPAPDPRTLQPDLPSAAACAVMRALSKQPDDRYPTAGVFAHALSDGALVS